MHYREAGATMGISQSVRSAELAMRIRAFMPSTSILTGASIRRPSASVPGHRIGGRGVKDDRESCGSVELVPGRTAFRRQPYQSRKRPPCAIMGRSHLGPEVFNCSAPDAGNMETILHFGAEGQISG
jgi:hypothetical protein